MKHRYHIKKLERNTLVNTLELEQRSEAWIEARLGKVTASRVADVMAKTKSGYSASRANYMAQLICERLTGTKGESFQNAAMAWGIVVGSTSIDHIHMEPTIGSSPRI